MKETAPMNTLTISICSSLLLVFLLGCGQLGGGAADDSEERDIIRQKGITKATCFTQTTEQPRYQSAETTYNQQGDVIRMVFLTPDGDTQTIEQHRYDAKDRLIETRKGNSLSKLELTYKDEFLDEKNQEIEYQYNLERGTVIRSVFTNDDQGRNQRKEYYVDDSLIATYQYHWDVNEDMVLTEGFNAKGEPQVKLTNSYQDHNCVSLKVYSEEKLVKADSNHYDENDRLIWTQTTVPGKYTDEISFEYRDGLMVHSKSKFENLDPSHGFVSEKQDDWEYH